MGRMLLESVVFPVLRMRIEIEIYIYCCFFFVRTQFLILTIPPSCVVPTMGALAGPLAMLLKALIEMSYFVNFLKPVSCTFVVAQPFTVKLLL